jgi:hypothetical protein
MICTLLCAAALAADAPEFLLADAGVRVDLPKSWKMNRWSDWDFHGQNAEGSVLVFAWSTPFQVPVTDAAAWTPVFEAKVAELAGKDPKPGATALTELGGRKVAFVDVGFQFGDGNRGTMYGATVEVEGKNFHFATVSPDRFSGAGKKARQDLVARLEYSRPPPPSTFGAEVAAKGLTTKLPDDWRPSLDAEWTQLVPSLAKLGLEDVTDCWIAVRPKPNTTPDAMVTCARKASLGVVDEHSAAAADEVVRKSFFGSIPPGVPVALADRTGLLYTPKDGVAFGVVPDAEGVAVTWALGDGDLGPAVRAAMERSTYGGPHPVTTGETISYWLTARTFSPQVLCPALGCVGLGGALVVGAGAVALGLSRRRGGGDEEHDAEA